MTNSLVRRSLFDHMPALFNSSIFDEFDRIFDVANKAFEFNIGYPYNIKNVHDDVGNVVSTKVEIALAGIPKENVSIKVVDSSLQIEINKVEEKGTEKESYAYRGISRRSLKQSIELAPNADIKNIKSSFKDGCLTIDIPLIKQTSNERVIEIE